MSSPLTTAGRSALAWTPIVAATIVVTVRVFVRAKLRTIGTEDYLMITSLLCALLSASLAVTSFYERPKNPTSQAHVTAVAWLAAILASLSISFAKASVGFLLLRLLGPASRRLHWFIITSLHLLAVVQVFQLIGYLFPKCSQPHALESPNGCIQDAVSLGFFQLWNVYAILIDVAYSAVPVTVIYRLNMRRSKNIAVAVLLGLGWLASIFTLIRTIASYGVFSVYWNHLVTPMCTAMEQGLVMIAGSLATLLPLYHSWSKGKPLRPRREWESPTIDNRQQRAAAIHLTKSSGETITKVGTGAGYQRRGSTDDTAPSIRVDQEIGVDYSRDGKMTD